jgi:hypothetical protein
MGYARAFWPIRLLLAFSLAVLATSPTLAQKRIALSVGIDAYDKLPAHGQLKKAVNDARAMAEALAELGFETMREENLTCQGFLSA